MIRGAMAFPANLVSRAASAFAKPVPDASELVLNACDACKGMNDGQEYTRYAKNFLNSIHLSNSFGYALPLNSGLCASFACVIFVF